MTRSLKERVLAYIRETDTVTFAELSRHFVEFRDGDFSMCVAENVILWINMTEEATAALEELREEGLIVGIPTSVLTYAIDGMLLKFPIAKRAAAYKAPHWSPMVWRPIERVPLKILRLVNKARQKAGRSEIPAAA